MTTIAVTRIHHVGIRVHDLGVSRDFYAMFGFGFVVGPIGPEPVAILRHPTGIEINLILNAPGPPEANVLIDVPEKHACYTHIALHIGDLEATRRGLDEAGIPLSGEMHLPDGGVSVFVRDPDRNVIELHHPASR